MSRRPPAHQIVDSQAVEAVRDISDANLESESASVRFLSAPPRDPVADAFPGTAGDMDANDEQTGDIGRGAKGDTLDWLHEQAKRRAHAVPEFDVEKTLRKIRADQIEHPTDVTEALAASSLLLEAVSVPASRVWDASDVVTEIYTGHYNQLVRLAVMLVHDVQTAEEVVQDSFDAMHLAWRRLRDTEKALSYLRQAIVNRSRSVLRHRKVVEMHAPKPAPYEQSAEHAALTLIERSAVTSALRSLPVRQREAFVLRYYGDFSEADVATAMGISRGAVKSHTARAMAALKSMLEDKA